MNAARPLPADPPDDVVVEQLGVVPYREALAMQERLHAERVAGRRPDTLLLLEHEPVITLGRSGGDEFLHGRAASDDRSPVRHPDVGEIEVVQTDRGGKITYHGPGQLVGYGIVSLAERGLLPAPYVHHLEAVVVQLLGEIGLDARTKPGCVGVWVGDRKIASIGVRVRQGVAMHGFGLNVVNALGPFEVMDPCGLEGVRMTSVAAELGSADLPAIRDRAATLWRDRLATLGRPAR